MALAAWADALDGVSGPRDQERGAVAGEGEIVELVGRCRGVGDGAERAGWRAVLMDLHLVEGRLSDVSEVQDTIADVEAVDTCQWERGRGFRLGEGVIDDDRVLTRPCIQAQDIAEVDVTEKQRALVPREWSYAVQEAGARHAGYLREARTG